MDYLKTSKLSIPLSNAPQMNYYKVGMNYELHMVYIPYHNNEKGICMNLLLVEDDLNLGKILKRQWKITE